VSLLHAGSYTLRAYSIIPEHWPTVPPQHLAEIDPRAIPALDLPPPQKIGSPSFFFIFFSSFFQCSTTPLPPRILTHDGPCFKLADQSPKPLGHRNWPRILFLLDLWWGGGGGGRVPVYTCDLPPKRSLSLSEDKCSPNSMAVSQRKLFFGRGKDRDKPFVW